MSCISIQDILKSVEILYDPSVVGNEKAVASEILSRLTESPTYYQIAMEILLSNDNSVSFNARFYALNLLINMFNKDWNKMITDNQICILQFLEKYMISNAPMDIRRNSALGSKFAQLFATGMTVSWPSQWKTCTDTINQCLTLSDEHFCIALQVLYYFVTDLTRNQEDINSISGRKKRIKSFLPHVQSLINQCVSSIAHFNSSPYIYSINTSFIQFIIVVMKIIPENMIIACLPSIHSCILPLLSQSCYLSDCLSYIASLAEHSFAKENRSTIKVILELIMKVEKILPPYSSSLEAYEITQLFITILSTFIRTQIGVLFPFRDEKEAKLLQILMDMVIRNLQFPSIRSESLLLSCISYLFQEEELNPHPNIIEIKEKSISELLHAFYQCYIIHVINSPSFAPLSIREYESQAAYTHAFSDLKKNIREGIYPLVQFNALLVLQPIFQLLSSEMMYNSYSALAVICLTKGCIEGIAQQRISINDPSLLKGLLHRLHEILVSELSISRLSLLQTLSIVITMTSLSFEECEMYMQPLFIALSSYQANQDTNIETEVAKYLRSLVESQLSQLSPHYGVIGSDFQKLCLQDGIIDTTRSNLLHAYMMLVLSLQDESIIVNQIKILITSFLSIITNKEVQEVWQSSVSFKACFESNLTAMSNVTTAFNAVADIITSINSVSLRLSITSFLMSLLFSSMISLTSVICEVSTTINQDEINRGVVWIASTQKELSNQHSSIQFHHSEKLFSLYKSVMRCWKELLLNESNHSEFVYQSLTQLSCTWCTKIRPYYLQEWIQSIFIPVYLSCPYSPFPELLLSFLHQALLSLNQSMKSKSYDSRIFNVNTPNNIVIPYHFYNETNEIIVHNIMSIFYNSISTFLLYLIGNTMRGMSMSLVNRPYLQNEGRAEEGKRYNTQTIIDQRIEGMKIRFVNSFLIHIEIKHALLECISLILKSNYIQAIQSIFPFLLSFLPLLENYSNWDFLSFLFIQLLHLYLTTQNDRCKDISQCCLFVLKLIYRQGQGNLSNGNVITVDDFIRNMAISLQMDGKELSTIIFQILSLHEEKDQIVRLRKVLEEARKNHLEKGVPVHL